VNGTLVARRTRTTFVEPGSIGTSSTEGEALPTVTSAWLARAVAGPRQPSGGIRTRRPGPPAAQVVAVQVRRPAGSSYLS
jgi:hypothetical protein